MKHLIVNIDYWKELKCYYNAECIIFQFGSKSLILSVKCHLKLEEALTVAQGSIK